MSRKIVMSLRSAGVTASGRCCEALCTVGACVRKISFELKSMINSREFSISSGSSLVFHFANKPRSINLMAGGLILVLLSENTMVYESGELFLARIRVLCVVFRLRHKTLLEYVYS